MYAVVIQIREQAVFLLVCILYHYPEGHREKTTK